MATGNISSKIMKATDVAPHKNLRSRIGALAVSGCLALSMCPAVAFAAPGDSAGFGQDGQAPAMEQNGPGNAGGDFGQGGFGGPGQGGQGEMGDFGQGGPAGQMGEGEMTAPENGANAGQAPSFEGGAADAGQAPSGELPENAGDMPADGQTGMPSDMGGAPQGNQPDAGQMPNGQVPGDAGAGAGQAPDGMGAGAGQMPGGQMGGDAFGGKIAQILSSKYGVTLPDGQVGAPAGQNADGGQMPSAQDGDADSNKAGTPGQAPDGANGDLGPIGAGAPGTQMADFGRTQAAGLLSRIFDGGMGQMFGGMNPMFGAMGNMFGAMGQMGQPGAAGAPSEAPELAEGEVNVQQVIDTVRDIVQQYGVEALESADFSDSTFTDQLASDIAAASAKRFQSDAEAADASQATETGEAPSSDAAGDFGSLSDETLAKLVDLLMKSYASSTEA